MDFMSWDHLATEETLITGLNFRKIIFGHIVEIDRLFGIRISKRRLSNNLRRILNKAVFERMERNNGRGPKPRSNLRNKETY